MTYHIKTKVGQEQIISYLNLFPLLIRRLPEGLYEVEAELEVKELDDLKFNKLTLEVI